MVWSSCCESLKLVDLCLSSRVQCPREARAIATSEAALPFRRPPSATPITAKPITHRATTPHTTIDGREVSDDAWWWASGLRISSPWPPRRMSCEQTSPMAGSDAY